LNRDFGGFWRILADFNHFESGIWRILADFNHFESGFWRILNVFTASSPPFTAFPTSYTSIGQNPFTGNGDCKRVF